MGAVGNDGRQWCVAVSGRHVLPRTSVDGALASLWGVGTVAALALLGVMVADSSAQAVDAPHMTLPDLDSEDIATAHATDNPSSRGFRSVPRLH